MYETVGTPCALVPFTLAPLCATVTGGAVGPFAVGERLSDDGLICRW